MRLSVHFKFVDGQIFFLLNGVCPHAYCYDLARTYYFEGPLQFLSFLSRLILEYHSGLARDTHFEF